ncbi:MAG: glycosyltransferase [Deltaproteobacteria bacterium]|nr:glycosyltransferase [Deltaproteobacteria bacterium]
MRVIDKVLRTIVDRIVKINSNPSGMPPLREAGAQLSPKLPETSKESIQGDILFLSPDLWDVNRWARKQMLAYLLQVYFNKVFYSVDYRHSGMTRPVLNRVAESMYVYNQGVRINRWNPVAEETASRNLLGRIKGLKLRPKAIMAYQFHNYVQAKKVVEELGQGCKIFYDLTDDWTFFPGFSEEKRQKRFFEEEMAIKGSDKVFSVSKRLYGWAKKLNINSVLLPNATDFELMKTTQEDGPIANELKGLKSPIIGYTGRITPWRLDWGLLERIADMEEKPTVVMIGEVHPGSVSLRDKLIMKENVKFLGPKEYCKLPTFYRSLDVCILPHSTDTQTASMDPIKLYDYMGTGRPIVATAVEEAKKFSDVLRLANSHDDFLALLRETWRDKNHDPRPQMETARQNSWIRRTEQLASHIALTIGDSTIKSDYDGKTS